MSTSAAQGPLLGAIVALAAAQDDNLTALDDSLRQIVMLTVARVGPAEYASVTTRRSAALTTVAMSKDLALAVDEAPDGPGNDDPGEDASKAGRPGSNDIATTVSWPGFRELAEELGLQASLSIPLFAGRGATIAALNLFARTATALDPLTDCVRRVFSLHEHDTLPITDDLDPGGAELVAGLVEAFYIQQRIQIAVGLLMQTQRISADFAYLRLREHTVSAGVGLLEAATEITIKLSPH